MAKQRDVFLGLLVGAFIVMIATGSFSGFLGSVTQDGGEGDIPADLLGKDATLSAAVYDRAAGTSTQVSADLHCYQDNGDRIYLGATSTASDSRTDITDYVVGNDFSCIAFDSTYDYGVMKEGLMDQQTKNVNFDAYTGISSGSVSVTFYDEEDSSTTDISTLGADQEYQLSKIVVSAAASDSTYNPHVIAFKKAAGSNISSIEMPGAREVPVPDTLTDYDKAFVVSAFGANEGQPALEEWQKAQTGSVILTADGDGTSGETLTVAVKDLAPYVNNEDEVVWDVEDDATTASDVGVSDVTATLTV